MEKDFPISIEFKEVINVDFDLHKPVLDLKNLLEKKTGVEVKHQQLIYNGREMQDEHPLDIYNLPSHRSTILLSRATPSIATPSIATATPSIATDSRLTVERPAKRIKSVRGRRLVLCFTPFVGYGDPLHYSFQSFPIEELICPSSTSQQTQLEPVETFDWVESRAEPSDTDARTPHYFYISFVKAKEANLLYAVPGGQDIFHTTKDSPLDWCGLPRNFNRISLSALLEDSKVDSMVPMKQGKFYPLIVEIDGLIYALSRPFQGFSSDLLPCFEVYHPSEDNWLLLSAPPFLTKEYRNNFYRDLQLFPYVVIGGKLHVSCGTYSCTYDPVRDQWGPCNLFPEFPERPPSCLGPNSYMSNCGPAFPFLQTPILLHQETILLCVDTIFNNLPIMVQLMELYYHSATPEFCDDYEAGAFIPPISAYRITDDKTRAEKIPIKLDKLPYGEFCQIIDLGNDHFAVLLYEADKEDQPFCHSDCVTIATFKLELKWLEDGSLSSLEGKCISLLYCDSLCMPEHRVGYAFVME